MICPKCGGEMEARSETRRFCPLCGYAAEVGLKEIGPERIEDQPERPRGFWIGRMCVICMKKEHPGARVYQDWCCPECVGILREIVAERKRRNVHGL